MISRTASYQESAVLTATPEKLVVMLYDGAHRFLVQSATALRDDDVERAGERLGRAEAIIDELLATLDPTAGDITERLKAIYVFWRRYLGEARLERDALKIDQVATLVADLRGAWAEAAAHAQGDELPAAEPAA
jgi:flagellar secretion chaperone FliS